MRPSPSPLFAFLHVPAAQGVSLGRARGGRRGPCLGCRQCTAPKPLQQRGQHPVNKPSKPQGNLMLNSMLLKVSASHRFRFFYYHYYFLHHHPSSFNCHVIKQGLSSTPTTHGRSIKVRVNPSRRILSDLRMLEQSLPKSSWSSRRQKILKS